MPRPPIPCEPDLLARASVRLLREDEWERFDQLLQERHYLHSAPLVGQHLRFVAKLDGQWVALLAFSAVATLMGACGYRAYEDTCSKFTTRQLRALGGHPDDGELRAPSDSTFRRVLMRLDPQPTRN